MRSKGMHVRKSKANPAVVGFGAAQAKRGRSERGGREGGREGGQERSGKEGRGVYIRGDSGG